MKETDLFDKLDNVLANYIDGKAKAVEVVWIADKVNTYLKKHPHPHDLKID